MYLVLHFQRIQSVPPFTFSALCDSPEASKKNRKFFSIFSFLRAFVVSSCRKSGFRVFLSLRYGADLGHSRLVCFYANLIRRSSFPGLAFVNNTCARSNAAVSGVCTVAFGIPLRICKSVLLIFEHLFGVKHRAILVAQRKKSRRSNLNVENSRLDDSAVDLTSGSPSLTPGKRNLPAGVKFDMENSPGAAKLLNLVSPNKRRASMSDGEEEEETSFDDSSNDEVVSFF